MSVWTAGVSGVDAGVSSGLMERGDGDRVGAGTGAWGVIIDLRGRAGWSAMANMLSFRVQASVELV